jgi:hypothetical protein
MKKYSVYIIVFAACLFSEGCISSQSGAPVQGKIQSPLEFTPVVWTSIVPFDKETPESTQFEIHLMLSEPVDSDAGIEELVRKLLYKGQSAADYGKAVITEHSDIYTGLRAEWIPRGAARIPSFNWYYTEEVKTGTVPVKDLLPGRENLLVLIKTTESYFGGAHPNSSTVSFVIDPDAVKRLILDDIFGSREELRGLLEAELRRKYQLPEGAPLSEAGFFTDRVELPENFFLTEEAPENLSGRKPRDSPFMHFLWNAYETAPYVMGAIELSLPLRKLSPLFRKQAPE